MTAQTSPTAGAALAGLLADPARMRVLAAVALGADRDAAIADAAALSPREVAPARLRLEANGVLVRGGGRSTVAYDVLARWARERPASAGGTALAPFVAGDRLLSLPAQQSRRRTVLEHVLGRSFTPGEVYEERAVDERLRAWCDGGEVDHVALRRYLVDGDLLTRRDGRYWVTSPERDAPLGAAEQAVRDLGLA